MSYDGFVLPHPCDERVATEHLDRIAAFLSTPLAASLLSCHVNQVTLGNFDIPADWEVWWDWAGEPVEEEDKATLLLEYANGLVRLHVQTSFYMLTCR